MQAQSTELPEVLLLEPKVFGDERGYFMEAFHQTRFAELTGKHTDFVQDNQSLSRRAGTVRGLHLQVAPHAQAKLVRVLVGAVIDVAVDLRAGSPTYGEWVSAELSARNGAQLLVPRGFAHGFRTLVDDTEVAYKVDGFYDRDSERGIRFDDPALGIDWGGAGDIVLSQKDAALPAFEDLGPVAF